MLSKVKDFLRRQVRGTQRAGQYPLLLPHHTLTDTGIRTVNGDHVALPPPIRAILALCDGRTRLADVAKKAGASKADLIKAQDDGLVLIWRSAVPSQPPATSHHPHSIIVSPHLDDAALSCGGRMLGDQAVLVVNVFSKTAWWRFGIGDDQREKIQACREMEENLVARLSGASIVPLGLPEALLRGYAMEDVFGKGREELSSPTATEIRDAIIRLAKENPLSHWFLPLGVGNHVDHILTRDAAISALRQADVKNTHLHFYEDLPYAAKLGPAADFSGNVPEFTLQEELLEIDELLGWKLELLRAYWSQFRWAELAEIGVYARSIGESTAEVCWGTSRKSA